MVRPSEEQCLNLIETGVVTAANADISGIGVLIAFHLSAYVTFMAVLLAYCFGIIDDELLAPVDRKVFHVSSRSKQYPRLRIALREFILTLSDNQVVTGIAILAAGFRGLVKGDISVYHYQVVLYLAWLSSSVHLSAISLLRPYLTQDYGLKAWRLVAMVVLFIMLLVGLVPTIHPQWGVANPEDPGSQDLSRSQPTGWGVPAICFWGKLRGEGVNSDAPLGYAILILSYIWKIGDMFTAPRRLYHRFIRLPSEALMEWCLTTLAQQHSNRQNFFYRLLFRLCLMMVLPCLAILETMVSFSASLWLSVLGLVFGTLQVQIPRNQNLASTGQQEEEWGFGQLVPLVLLVQPLGILVENIFKSSNRLRSQVQNQDAAPPGEHELEVRALSDARQEPLYTTHDPESTRYNRRSGEALLNALAGRQSKMQIIPDDPDDMPSEFYDITMSSTLFALLVGSLHVAITVGAILIFWVNANTIGLQRGGNWFLLMIAVSVYVIASWTIVGVLGPCSRLWKFERR